MTDPDVQRLNRIRADFKKELENADAEGPFLYAGFRVGLLRGLEIVERVWELFYEGKSEERDAEHCHDCGRARFSMSARVGCTHISGFHSWVKNRNEDMRANK